MSDSFPILKVHREMRRDVEQLGSKPKFWFERDGETWLFKEARVNTGEDWSEKIASEIAALMGLPTHHAELAEYEGQRGCAVRSFLSKDQTLVHGNEVLAGLIAGYDKEKERGQSDHTFDNIVTALEATFIGDSARTRAASSMAGYLVLDALVGNTDRHHQNWGFVISPLAPTAKRPSFAIRLAPSFDHASSLGRELLDAKRQRILDENSIESYIRRAPGAIFLNQSDRKGLSPIAMAQELARRYPAFFEPWQARVAELNQDEIDSLVRKIPGSRISRTGKTFVLAFLRTSRSLISLSQ